ncbi:hypothetical protein J0910_30475 [Nocardiopsis sp. CNT-189]|uniref:hypothetical protein n=1 Tax=Nocardiopsis oceanisediminis TaxID=2816862 RepID=UPI003B2A8D98
MADAHQWQPTFGAAEEAMSVAALHESATVAAVFWCIKRNNSGVLAADLMGRRCPYALEAGQKRAVPAFPPEPL